MRKKSAIFVHRESWRTTRNRVIIGLLLAVASLLVIGVVMMASLEGHVEAASRTQSLSTTGQVRNQLVSIGIGLILMSFVSRVDYRRWRLIATPFAGLVFMLLVLALIPGMGPSYYGARRWLYLGPWGVFQPSHLAGMALVLFMAWWYGTKRKRLGYLFWVPFWFLGCMASPILVEPDVTTALLMVMTGGCVMILGGEKLYYLLYCVFMTASGLAWLILRDPMRMARISAIFMGEPPEPIGLPLYTLALASGGWSGVGLGKGHYVSCFLPEAGTEFMSAFIGEELGMNGLLAMNAMYVIIAVSGAYIGIKSLDRFGTLLAIGIVSLIVMPVLLNLLILATPLCLHFPLLPFVSGGGLHLCMSLIGVGVLLSIARTKGRGECHEP